MVMFIILMLLGGELEALCYRLGSFEGLGDGPGTGGVSGMVEMCVEMWKICRVFTEGGPQSRETLARRSITQLRDATRRCRRPVSITFLNWRRQGEGRRRRRHGPDAFYK